MVHGYGKNGGRGRCYIFWNDLLTCVRHAESANIDHVKECELQREDYLECLHHKKLVRLALEFQTVTLSA